MKQSGVAVYVGDFGETVLDAKTLKAYGIKSYPINRRSSTQRRALQRLETNVKALQDHTWLLGRTFDKA